ncbi:hydroxymethylbilane synthase [Dinghuibacter silviterrae]|uniref:Hydroxymethylbilane synthase n=1 Tax=Dinghuibacter silviterrae TaxID=1539049 RepID=A0A4R8DE91_9BACT|nr:hydroxymethylbilane synthase [Dinghuibacter silviterrae]TDW95735.1 hydroxymethylbilane synthase [Dinghuibacter silviterrae]
MQQTIRIGTRDSQLAVWQATLVRDQLVAGGHSAELVYIKSEGDIDLVTPLYAIGVQGVFTRTLDAALLSGRIDMAVHSMKDVPVQLAQGLAAAAVLTRANPGDLFVYKGDAAFLDDPESIATIATSSLRRRAQWLHRYPHHRIDNLRGNVNTRLAKVASSDWQGALFAAAGLERIGLRPANSIPLDWMLPAPAQGAILVACREDDTRIRSVCAPLHHEPTALCVDMERTFLSALMGGCSTPIGALAEIAGDHLRFRGNACSLDGKTCLSVEKKVPLPAELSAQAPTGESLAQASLGESRRAATADLARAAAGELLARGATTLIQKVTT